jgi:hypothetical protein
MTSELSELAARAERIWLRWGTPAVVAVTSFVVTAWIPILNDSPYADISGWYTDHLHHSFATWVFLKRGLAVYTHPLGALPAGTGWPFPREDWGNMPMAYPPGVFAVFSPLVVLAKILPLSEHGFAVLSVLYVLLLTHLALFSVLRALEDSPRGSRAAVAVFVWMVFVQLGLEGFYDAAFIGCGARAVSRLRAKDGESALWWLGVAALLHFRAIVFLPLALYTLAAVLRGKPRATWPWATLAWVAAAAAVSVATFLLMYPATAGFRASHHRVLFDGGVRVGLVVALGAVALAVAFRAADGWVAATVAVCLGLAAVEVQDYWWHAAVLFVPPLLVGVAREARHASVARAILLGWACSTMPLVWRDSATQLFPELVKYFRIGSEGRE